MMTVTVTAYCVAGGCRCLDRAGVVLYRGPSLAAALHARRHLAPAGYRTAVERVRPGPPARY